MRIISQMDGYIQYNSVMYGHLYLIYTTVTMRRSIKSYKFKIVIKLFSKRAFFEKINKRCVFRAVFNAGKMINSKSACARDYVEKPIIAPMKN